LVSARTWCWWLGDATVESVANRNNQGGSPIQLITTILDPEIAAGQ
jgi:hypothetical protein